MHHNSNDIVLLEIEQEGKLNHDKGMLMQIWLLMHLVWQRALKMRNLKLIMKLSLVESLHSGSLLRMRRLNLFKIKPYLTTS